MSAVAPPVELLHDVSLEQFAGVAAALIEGFPLAAILANEQIDPRGWPKAETAWKARVAKDGVDGPIFAALREKRAVAEDCLARGVAPIDTDLGAWMSFLQAYGAHPAPAQLLEGARAGARSEAHHPRRSAPPRPCSSRPRAARPDTPGAASSHSPARGEEQRPPALPVRKEALSGAPITIALRAPAIASP